MLEKCDGPKNGGTYWRRNGRGFSYVSNSVLLLFSRKKKDITKNEREKFHKYVRTYIASKIALLKGEIKSIKCKSIVSNGGFKVYIKGVDRWQDIKITMG